MAVVYGDSAREGDHRPRGSAARRRYNDEEKLRLVEEAFSPGVTTAEYARRAGVDQSLLYRWRRQFFGQQVRLPAFTPVTAVPDETVPRETAAPSGAGELEFAGGVRVRITGTVTRPS